MAEQLFESALAECLAALDAGAPVEDVLARFPAYAEALRPALGLRTALDAHEAPLPPTMRARGEQRLQAALAAPALSGGIPVLSSLFGSLPKAAAQALIGLAVTGSAIGASAAAGGPNIPQEVLQAVGIVDEHANENASANTPKGKAKGQAKATSTAAAQAEADNSLKGLCTAYTKGGLGQNAKAGENPKSKSTATPAASPMARLEAARAAATPSVATIGELCASLLEDGEDETTITSTAESGNPGRGKGLEKSATAAAIATTGQGKALEAPGKSR